MPKAQKTSILRIGQHIYRDNVITVHGIHCSDTAVQTHWRSIFMFSCLLSEHTAHFVEDSPRCSATNSLSSFARALFMTGVTLPGPGSRTAIILSYTGLS